METQKERLEQFITTIGHSTREFERAIGVSNGTVRHITGTISANLKEKISASFPQLNMDWILSGDGEMMKEDYRKKDSLPLVPLDAVAGFNGIDEAGVRLADCPQYSIPDFREAKADFLIKVNGSSMYPNYVAGDILACRKIEEATFIQWGKVYVIDSQQGAMVKRLFEIEGDGECLLCKSDNANYPPFKLPKAEIRSLSIVIGVIRLE